MNIIKSFSITLGALIAGMTFAIAQPMSDDAAGAGNQTEYNAANANWKPSLVPDGAIEKTDRVHRALEWAPIREIDVAWKTRVWREIDVREKQNQAFIYVGDEYSGGGAFIEVLLDLIKRGRVAAYEAIDDRFTTELTEETLEEALGATTEISEQIDPITFEPVFVEYTTEFDVNSIVKYQIKEDVIFDRNLGRAVVRIIGIAPIKFQEVGGEDVSQIVEIPMFWLYYPELRTELVNYEVYNPINDMRRMTWTDLLDNRYFSSYIIKTSNNNPRSQRLKRNDIRSLYMGEQLERELMEREMDMWEN